jgi:hypothetical protein
MKKRFPVLLCRLREQRTLTLENKKGHGMCLFRGLLGSLYSIYTGKKLIESPLSHGNNVPCRFQTALNSEEEIEHHEK